MNKSAQQALASQLAHNYRDYYTAKMLAERYCVNACTIWRWVDQKKLPSPVQFSTNCTRWRGADIQAAEAKMGVA